MTLVAYTREVSPTLADCELTHLEREPLDVVRAAAEHHAYEELLSQLGATVRRLPAAPALPQSSNSPRCCDLSTTKSSRSTSVAACT